MNIVDLKALMSRWATLANEAVEAGKDAVPFIKIAYETFASGGVTDEKLGKLQAFNDAQHNELQAPVEPEGP